MQRVFTPDRCPTSDDWSALLDGAVPNEFVAALEAHLDACPACSAHLQELARETPSWIKWAAEAIDAGATAGDIWYLRLRSELRAGESTISQATEFIDEGPDLPPHTHIGDYEIRQLLGRGGMGYVYRARQIKLQREVAVKMLRSHSNCTPAAMHRLISEAQRLAQMKHPNIVQVYDVGEQDGRPFFSMELVEGKTLSAINRKSPYGGRKAAELTKTIAEAVHAAHTAGVIHRDLKPANILMAAAGQPKVTDFGLATTRDDAISRGQREPEGTAEYMAPEQWAGDAELIGPRTDVYGLGGILYELLTGQPPFPRDCDADKTRRRVMYATPTAPHKIRAKVPRDLEAICLRCLEKSPDRRYPTAQAVADDLDRFLHHYPVSACPPSLIRRGTYLCRRIWKPLTAVVVTLLIVGAVAFPFFKWLMDARQVAAAELLFESGSRKARDGHVRAGLIDMRRAVEQTPKNNEALQEFFQQSISRWDATQSRISATHHHHETVAVAGVSPTGRDVLFGDESGNVWLWSAVHDAKRHLATRGATHRIEAVAFDNAGILCAAGDEAGWVRVWNTTTGRQVAEFPLGQCIIYALAFLGNEDVLVSGSSDKAQPLRFWSMNTTSFVPSVAPLSGIGDAVTELSPAPDGQLVAAMTQGGRCWVVDRAGQVRHEVSRSIEGTIQAVAFSRDGHNLLTAAQKTGQTPPPGPRIQMLHLSDGSVKELAQFEPGTFVQQMIVRQDSGLSLAVEQGGRHFVRQGNATVDAWEDFPLESVNGTVGSALDNHVYVLSGTRSATLELSVLPNALRRSVPVSGPIGLGHVIVSADGQRYSLIAYESEIQPARVHVQIRDRTSLRLLSSRTSDALSLKPWVIAPSPRDGNFALGCGVVEGKDEAGIYLTAPGVDNELPLQLIGAHRTSVMALAYSPDGKFLVSGSIMDDRPNSAELSRWQVASGQRIASVAYPCSINILAVAPDGRTIAVGDGKGHVKLVQPANLEGANAPGITMEGAILALDYSRDGRFLAAGSSRGQVVVCQIVGDQLKVVARPEVTPGRVAAVQFTADSTALLVATDVLNNGISIWNTHVWRPIGPPVPVQGRILHFSMVGGAEVAVLTSDGRLATVPIPWLK
jgi:WD40 repeat protein/predicted Ser/Thr protein kinase